MIGQVLLSHAEADLSWAEWIAWELGRAGYQATLPAWDFRPGSNWVLELERAMRAADRVLVLISPAYLENRAKQPEWTAAFSRDPFAGRVVPIRIQPCTPDGFLGDLLAVDLTGLNEMAARRRLLEGLAGACPDRREAPPFPGSGSQEAGVGQRPAFPGVRKPLGNIPHLPNPNFIGRSELLAQLRAKLSSGRPAVLTQTLSGLGGVGKTQLAVHYAYEFATDYQLVWWLRAEESAALASDFARLARHLRLSEEQAIDQREAIAAARAWLEEHPGWLLVFDNAEEPADLRHYIPRAGSGHVLITSRNPIWRGIADSLAVQPFEESESVRFLLQATGQAKPEIAAELAEALGHLPLALDQAAAYIHATGISVSEYRSMFDRYSVRLLTRGQLSTDYPGTVATTWAISFDKVRQLSSAAEGLINVLAFLGAETIPRRLILSRATSLPEPLRTALGDPLTLHEAIMAVQRYSLVSVQANDYNIHRLVQAVIRDRLGEAGEIWLRAAAALVDAAFEFDHDDPTTWEECRRLLPHAIAISSFKQFDLDDEATGRLFHKVGQYLSERGDYADARVILGDALRVQEAVLGPEHPSLVSLRAELALTEQALGRFREADDLLRQALENLPRPEEDPNTGAVLALQALIHLAVGDHRAALAMLHEALDIVVKRIGDDSAATAATLADLALVRHIRGDLDGALKCMTEAFQRLTRVLPPDHPAVSSAASNLGLLLLDAGRKADARPYLDRAAEIDESTYGIRHPHVVIHIVNRALANELDGSAAASEPARVQDEARFTFSHRCTTAAELNNHALQRGAAGDWWGARVLLEDGLSILRGCYQGGLHPNLAPMLLNLGHVAWKVGEPEEARRRLEEALSVTQMSEEPSQAMISRIMSDLGSVLAARGDVELARDAFEKSIALARQISSASLLDRAVPIANLAALMEQLGRDAEANALYRQSLRLSHETRGSGQAVATLAREALGRIYKSSHNVGAARGFLEQAVTAELAAKPRRRVLLAFCLNNLAAFLADQGSAERATELLFQARDLCTATSHVGLMIRENLAVMRGDRSPGQHLNPRIWPTGEGVADLMPAAGIITSLAGVSPGGRATFGTPVGNAIGWLLCGPLLHAATCLQLELMAPRRPAESARVETAPSQSHTDVGLLYRRHKAGIVGYLTRRGLSDADAEDLTHDIFARLCGTRPVTLVDEFAYLRRAADHEIVKHWRTRHSMKRGQGRDVSLEFLVEWLGDLDKPWSAGLEHSRVNWLSCLSVDQEDALDVILRRERQRDQLRALRAAILKLPPEVRMMARLAWVEGLDYREVASRQKLSYQRVRALLYEARRILMFFLRKDEE